MTLGMVTNIHPQIGLMVKLPFGAMGTVAVTDLADAYRPNPLEVYSKDQLLRSVAAVDVAVSGLTAQDSLIDQTIVAGLCYQSGIQDYKLIHL